MTPKFSQRPNNLVENLDLAEPRRTGSLPLGINRLKVTRSFFLITKQIFLRLRKKNSIPILEMSNSRKKRYIFLVNSKKNFLLLNFKQSDKFFAESVCPICLMDIVSEIQTRLPPCGHQTCLDCSKSYIKQLIDSNKVTGFFIGLISD